MADTFSYYSRSFCHMLPSVKFNHYVTPSQSDHRRGCQRATASRGGARSAFTQVFPSDGTLWWWQPKPPLAFLWSSRFVSDVLDQKHKKRKSAQGDFRELVMRSRLRNPRDRHPATITIRLDRLESIKWNAYWLKIRVYMELWRTKGKEML